MQDLNKGVTPLGYINQPSMGFIIPDEEFLFEVETS